MRCSSTLATGSATPCSTFASASCAGHLRGPAARARPARHLRQGRARRHAPRQGREGAGDLHGRAAAHDRQRHLHHQRHRARHRLAAAPLARCVLRPRQRQDPLVRQAAVLGAAIPYRGSWLDFEFDPKDCVFVRIDRRRKLPATILLARTGYDTEQIWRASSRPTRCASARPALSSTWSPTAARRNARLRHQGRGRGRRRGGPPHHATPHPRARKGGIRRLQVPISFVVGKRLARNVIDTATGELLAKANEEMTAATVDALTKKASPRSRPCSRTTWTTVPTSRTP